MFCMATQKHTHLPSTAYLSSEPLRSMTDNAKVIWLWLMDNPDVVISIRDLSELLGIAARTVNQAMLTLEENQMLTRTPANGKRARSFSLKAQTPGIN
jgi:Mn-dependent DtxR family transcriptional regulator